MIIAQSRFVMFKSRAAQMTAQQKMRRDNTLEDEMAVKLEIIRCLIDLEEDQIGGHVFNLRIWWAEWQKADICFIVVTCCVSKGV